MNRDELIWAAGLFDGEGSTFASSSVKHIGRAPVVRLHIALSMTTPDVVHRFHAAVGGLGAVVGPYSHHRKDWKDATRWQATSFEHAQAVIAMLWNWLSGPKRQQAAEALNKTVYYANNKMPQRRGKTYCKRGHDLSVTRYRAPGGGRYCRECQKISRTAATPVMTPVGLGPNDERGIEAPKCKEGKDLCQ